MTASAGALNRSLGIDVELIRRTVETLWGGFDQHGLRVTLPIIRRLVVPSSGAADRRRVLFGLACMVLAAVAAMNVQLCIFQYRWRSRR